MNWMVNEETFRRSDFLEIIPQSTFTKEGKINFIMRETFE